MVGMLKLGQQLAILWAICWLSNTLVDRTGLPIPGNVVGVIVLFGLLTLGLVKLEHIQDAADFLLKHLVFFFVPVSVGLMNWGHVFQEHALTFSAAILVSTLLPFWVVGYITQWLHGRNG